MTIAGLCASRNVVTPAYALLTPQQCGASTVPGWSRCTFTVLISAALGAGFSQYVVRFDEAGYANGNTEQYAWFFFVMSGAAHVNGRPVPAGGFACFPPHTAYAIDRTSDETALVAFRRKPADVPAATATAAKWFVGHEDQVVQSPLQDELRAFVRPLTRDVAETGLDISMLTCLPGATFVGSDGAGDEHGLLFLSGGGVFRLGDDWYPVSAGDALWIAPGCSHAFLAAGPDAARLIRLRHREV